MSTSVLPTLIGQSFNTVRTAIWSNSVTQFISGKEIRINNGWTFPRYQWDINFDLLRSDTTNAEFQSLLGFYNARNGAYDSFLYSDPDDNSVTLQNIGIGDGTTLTYQLVKSFGGFTEPVFAPHTVSAVYVDGVDQVGHWTVSNWGSATPGILTFGAGHAPANSKVITATFTYYFPCRFVDDKVAFTNFVRQMWNNSKLSFISIK